VPVASCSARLLVESNSSWNSIRRRNEPDCRRAKSKSATRCFSLVGVTVRHFQLSILDGDDASAGTPECRAPWFARGASRIFGVPALAVAVVRVADTVRELDTPYVDSLVRFVYGGLHGRSVVGHARMPRLARGMLRSLLNTDTRTDQQCNGCPEETTFAATVARNVTIHGQAGAFT